MKAVLHFLFAVVVNIICWSMFVALVVWFIVIVWAFFKSKWSNCKIPGLPWL